LIGHLNHSNVFLNCILPGDKKITHVFVDGSILHE
jgi:hypothetical protein